MAITLQELQDRINEERAIIKTVNGNGFNKITEHPAQKSYNTMINRYTAAIKQLTDLLNSKEVKTAADELMDFIK
jgi:glutaminase